MLADKLAGLGLIDHISHTSVGELLAKNDLKPWQKKQWRIGNLTTGFPWRMENIPGLYERPYDPKRPLICSDGRPCQLTDDIVTPLPTEPGKPTRQDYHYGRNGVCSLPIAFGPHRGYRFAQVRKQRTRQDYAVFIKALAHDRYPEAEQLLLIRDNSDTHSPGSFYAAFPAEEAFALARRSDTHYAPNHASWPDMAEIGLSVISKCCPDRRIGDIRTLRREVSACVRERNDQHATVQWRFTKNDARTKSERFYPIDQN